MDWRVTVALMIGVGEIFAALLENLASLPIGVMIVILLVQIIGLIVQIGLALRLRPPLRQDV